MAGGDGALPQADDGKGAVPTSRFARAFKLGGLTSRVGASFLGQKVASLFRSAERAAEAQAAANLRNALRMVETLGDLRGALMKVGQFISIQDAILPKEFQATLGALQAQAPPMHFSFVKDVLKTELSRDPDSVFEDLERKPVAAASLGQVHRARLRGTGERVAIKVQYPGIDETIESDLKMVRPIVAALGAGGKAFDLTEAFEEVRERLREEVDYENEAANLEEFRADLASHEELAVPRVHRELSSRRVLTMEYLDGLHLDAFVATDPGPAAMNDAARKICDAIWTQEIGLGKLHADPHPGNFLFMPDGRIGLLDFGCVKRFSEAFKRHYRFVIARILDRDDDGVIEGYVRLGFLEEAERAGPKVAEFLRWSYLVCEPMMEDRVWEGDWGEWNRRMHDEAQRLVLRIGWYTPKDVVYLNRLTFGIVCFYNRLNARLNWRRLLLRHLERAADDPRPAAGEGVGRG